MAQVATQSSGGVRDGGGAQDGAQGDGRPIGDTQSGKDEVSEEVRLDNGGSDKIGGIGSETGRIPCFLFVIILWCSFYVIVCNRFIVNFT